MLHVRLAADGPAGEDAAAPLRGHDAETVDGAQQVGVPVSTNVPANPEARWSFQRVFRPAIRIQSCRVSPPTGDAIQASAMVSTTAGGQSGVEHACAAI